MAIEDDFERFVRERGPSLLRAAWLLVGSWPAAEDLVQTALERSWPRWPDLADDGQRRAYVHRVITTSYLRASRRRWNGEFATADLPQRLDSDRTDEVLMRRDVLDAVRRLPRRQRAVIALRYLADLTEGQTAAAMGCSTGTVKRYSARALSTLRADPALADLLTEGTRL